MWGSRVNGLGLQGLGLTPRMSTARTERRISRLSQSFGEVEFQVFIAKSHLTIPLPLLVAPLSLRSPRQRTVMLCSYHPGSTPHIDADCVRPPEAAQKRSLALRNVVPPSLKRWMVVEELDPWRRALGGGCDSTMSYSQKAQPTCKVEARPCVRRKISNRLQQRGSGAPPPPRLQGAEGESGREEEGGGCSSPSNDAPTPACTRAPPPSPLGRKGGSVLARSVGPNDLREGPQGPRGPPPWRNTKSPVFGPGVWAIVTCGAAPEAPRSCPPSCTGSALDQAGMACYPLWSLSPLDASLSTTLPRILGPLQNCRKIESGVALLYMIRFDAAFLSSVAGDCVFISFSCVSVSA